MTYEARDFRRLIGMKGFSEKMLTDHFGLYEGYVSNANQLLEKLSRLVEEDRADSPEYGEMKRRLGWEWNGVRLHELYFDNLGGSGDPDEAGDLLARITRQYGSYDRWAADFRATGSLRGIGWAILYHDRLADRLLNVWVNEHDTGHPAGAAPLLVMDAWEHAFMTDYGTDRSKYIDAFFENVSWAEVAKRFGR